MSDQYQRIQLKGEEEDGAQIVSLLASMKQGKLSSDVRLLNYFREIPISYPAKLLTVEESSAEFEVHQLQAVVMAQEKVTILKSPSFPRDVVANVTYVNIEKSRIVLSRFSYGLVRADRRMSVRVELTDPIYASFVTASAEVTGRLHDMSLSGISISVPRDPGIPPSELGSLTVILPIGSIALQATLVKVIEKEDGVRLAFQIEPTRDTENHISRYILQRQVEIIKELKDHPKITNA